MFKFRRAEQCDKDRVLEISSKIWDGEDYIHYVFDAWVKDKKGEFTVVELDGKVIGFAKYTKLVDGEAWLEGIRSDKSYSGKGFGDAMTKYYIDKAKDEGISTIRLSTFVENYESINIIEKNGFKKDGCFSFFYKEFDNISINEAPYDVVKINDTAAAWSFIEKSKFHQLSNGYTSRDWKFYKLNTMLLGSLVRGGNVIGVLTSGNISSMAIIMGDINGEEEISIGYLEGNKAEKNMLLDYIEATAEKHVPSVTFMCALDQELLDIMLEREYSFTYDDPRSANVYVYALQIKN